VEPDSASRLKSVGAGLLRWGLFLMVLWFVATQAHTLWDANRDIDVQIDWKYLVAAGVLSQLSWLPSTWFWQRLIELLGDQNLERYPLIRAYFCGSLGKYVPGKAAVILIRSALARNHGVSFVRASIASIVEAGAVMLVGCVVTIVFAVTVIPPDSLPTWVAETVPRESTSWSSLFMAIAALVLAMPVVAIPANWVFQKITRIVQKRSLEKQTTEGEPSEEPDDKELIDQSVGKLTWQFLAAASLMFALSWAGHGLSLLLVLRSMNPEIVSLDAWVISTAAAAAGTSIGFFAVFAPGGLAVREGLIITILAPSMGGPIAVAAAGLYRLASLIAESVAAAILYLIAPKDKKVNSGSLN
jgi:glycosyltransferase 2 family protein